MLPVPATVVSEQNAYRVCLVERSLPLPTELGQWLLDNRLYAEGNDFSKFWLTDNTGVFVDPKGVGNSMLKGLWSGSVREDTTTEVSLYVVERDGMPVGVVCWTHPATVEEGHMAVDEVRSNSAHKPRKRIAGVHLGQVSAFLKAEHRGQGLIKQVFADLGARIEQMGHRAKDSGRMPVVCGEDACGRLLRSHTTVPVVEFGHLCLGLRNDIWYRWTKQLCGANDPWMVTPTLIAPARKTKSPCV